MDAAQKQPGGPEDVKSSLVARKLDKAKRGRAVAKPAVGGRGRGAGTGPGIPGPSGVGKPDRSDGDKAGGPVRASQGLGRGLMGRAARANAAASAAAAVKAAQQQRAEAAMLAAAGPADRPAAGATAASDDTFAGTFAKELLPMMYGFGDDEAPLQESVEVVEAALLQYLGSVVSRASAVAASCLKPKLDEKDIMFVVRKDPAKFARIKELLAMHEIIREVRAISKDADT